jgi:hypothetical protein
MAKPPPAAGPNSTRAETSSVSAGVPFSASRWDNCMAKQPACAAAINSSGLVPDWPLSSWNRPLNE